MHGSGGESPQGPMWWSFQRDGNAVLSIGNRGVVAQGTTATDRAVATKVFHKSPEWRVIRVAPDIDDISTLTDAFLPVLRVTHSIDNATSTRRVPLGLQGVSVEVPAGLVEVAIERGGLAWGNGDALEWVYTVSAGRAAARWVIDATADVATGLVAVQGAGTTLVAPTFATRLQLYVSDSVDELTSPVVPNRTVVTIPVPRTGRITLTPTADTDVFVTWEVVE